MSRMTHEARRAHIIQAGIVTAQRMGYKYLTAQEVAASIGVSPSLIQNHFPLMEDFKDAVVWAAFEQGNAQIIAQAFSLGHPRASMADAAEKAKALAFIREA